MQKRTREGGITLVALVVTIIILIILAGISISLVLGDNGIVTKAKQGGNDYREAQAREKLELVLAKLQTDKITTNEYNANEYLEKKLRENKIALNGDIATVDGYSFEIDRSVPKIVSLLESYVPTLEKQVYLYKNGDEYPEIGGNWEVSQYGESDHGEFSKESDSLIVTGKYCYNRNYIIGKEQLIDLSPYTFLNAKVEVLEVSDTHSQLNTGMWLLDENGNVIANGEARIRNNGERRLDQGIETISIDLSKVDTKNAYVVFDTNSYKIKIYEVWLESKDMYTTISFDETANTANETLAVTVKQNSTTEMDLAKCKYVLTNQSEPYGIEDTIWQNANSFASLNQTLRLSIEDGKDYYLHVLSVNKEGNKIETVSNKIKRKQYLYQQSNDYSEVTGGWHCYINNEIKTATNIQTSYSDAHGTYQMEQNGLNITVIPVSVRGTGSFMEFRTENTIDLTNWNTIKIKASTTEMTDYQAIGVTKETDVRHTSLLPGDMNISFNENQNSLDISTIEGEYYIQFGMGSYLNATAKIEAIWLE